MNIQEAVQALNHLGYEQIGILAVDQNANIGVIWLEENQLTGLVGSGIHVIQSGATSGKDGHTRG